ncbi:ROK family transcriptional regulator [Amycolatopsis xylanica]|uniref:ROK family transcriptional regulator n=1 Tax=Amycolatopsis xylanica TaxID=589385 RepID=UPI001FE0F26B|nr:ROK family transcriptional regulator [Amycolatopsis xylanica]
MLLRSLYFGDRQSRQELSAATGLSPASVGSVMRELIDEGIVIEVGSVESDGGRPRVLLRVNPAHGHVIGVDVGETRVRVELFDLAMTERAKADYPLDRHDAEVVTARMLDGIAAVLKDGGVGAGSIIGVGIGVPGVVQREPEVLVDAQTFGWDRVPLERLLRAGTDLPLLVDNGANTMGRAELWFGSGRGTTGAVVALIGSGVGASIISGDAGFPGASASEFGHLVVVAGGRTCRCGNKGCLEAYVGAEAILDRFAEAGGIIDGGADQESALAAVSHDDQGTGVLAETVRYLGAGIGSLINLLAPERVILGGWAGLLLGDRNLDAIRAAARLHSLRHPFATTSIELCRLGPEAVALGAATLPVEQFLTG